MSFALQGRFLTTGPSGKSLEFISKAFSHATLGVIEAYKAGQGGSNKARKFDEENDLS